MSPKAKKLATSHPPLPPPPPKTKSQDFSVKKGLARYIHNPDSCPNQVVYHTDNFVAIKDLYPKASVHLLLLARGSETALHPFEALQDPKFLSSIRAELPRLIDIAASSLRQKFGKFSAQDEQRQRVLNGDEEWDASLPVGRNWQREIMVGVHAVPSMENLHVHVMSRDRYSECLKHRKHYNSFSTGFFVDIDAFPLAEDDPRLAVGKGLNSWAAKEMGKDLVCWKCGKNFGNKFAELKKHLEIEFIEWRKE